MKRISLFILLANLSISMNAQNMPPQAKKVPKELTVHGQTRIDNYFWMNDRNDPEVIQYLKDENTYTKTELKHTEPLQDKLFNEMKGRIKQTDMSVPYTLRGYEYYTRFEEGKEYPIHCRKKLPGGEEEILLNVNDLAKGESYCDVQGLTVSPDNTMLAYGVDNVSRRKYILHVKIIEGNQLYKQAVPNTDGSYVWANDNKSIFYDVKDDVTLRSYKIRKHVIGTKAEDDKDVFEEKDETFGCSVYKSKSEKYIFIGSYSTLTSETRFIDANLPESAFTIVQPRQRDMLYSVDQFGDQFYITTNLNAKNFKLVTAPISNPSKENWKDLIPHRPEVLLMDVEIFKNRLVLAEREKGLIRFRIRNHAGTEDFYLKFEESTYTAYSAGNPEFDTEKFRYGYTSLTTPSSVYDYDMNTETSVLLKQQEVLGGYKQSDYVTERLWAKAKDGTSIPISIVYKKGMQKTGKNNLLLYAYGSYGYSMDPSFSIARLSLLDRGFIFAIAHIRGGQEMGRQWYEDGKLLKKKNTFTDFIDCADYLIAQKYTEPNHLFAMGGSAGGLLMGAITNMRPELWKGVVAQVPFVDVVTTMLDESIPLTTGEFDEWGNPKDKKYYDYILSYSPYDNVVKKSYPNMLVTTGLHDSQVQYWEPAKWVAKLRELKTDNNKIMLHTEMEAGHGGKSGRFERLKEVALEYSFILDLAGIKE